MSNPTNANGPAAYGNDIPIAREPAQIAAGGIVQLTAQLPPCKGTYRVEWSVVGPTRLPDDDARVALLGATTVTGGQITLKKGKGKEICAVLDTTPLAFGSWRVAIELTKVVETDEPDKEEEACLEEETGEETTLPDCPHTMTGLSDPIEVTPRPFAAGDDVSVTLKRAAVPPTSDQALWVRIRNSTNAIGFQNYSRFLEAVICDQPDFAFDRREHKRVGHELRKIKRRTALPFPDIDRYRLLKAITEVFMMTHCGVDLDDFSDVDLDEESRRLNRAVRRGDLEAQMRDYLVRVTDGEGDCFDALPYLGLIRLQLRDVPVVAVDDDDEAAQICYGILAEKLARPCFLELIHDFWCEEAGVPRTLKAITRRFQNRSSMPGRDPLRNVNIDPLRPLNNLLWAVVQDEQHRLSPRRRAEEYAQEYGLAPAFRPGPPVRVAEARSRFIEAFHNLLALCSVFYAQDDNTTVVADGFGVLNALKETHLLLTEGAHNQYGDLPWTARQEMLMSQWILSLPQFREILPTRTMVVYPEEWIGRVDAMNRLQRWSDIPGLHYRDLAVFGEQLLLSIRFGAWTDVTESDRAGNWARYFRDAVQTYIAAYGAVTGVDLTQRRDRWVTGFHRRERARDGAYRG